MPPHTLLLGKGEGCVCGGEHVYVCMCVVEVSMTGTRSLQIISKWWFSSTHLLPPFLPSTLAPLVSQVLALSPTWSPSGWLAQFAPLLTRNWQGTVVLLAPLDMWTADLLSLLVLTAVVRFSAAYGINGWHTCTIRIIIMVLDMAVISYITANPQSSSQVLQIYLQTQVI